MATLTKTQRWNAELMLDNGWVPYRVGQGRMQRNRPLWKLVEMGLAHMDFGPSGSWLKSYCFMPVWSDPVC